MHATLDAPGNAPIAGEPLPPFWHWSHFWIIEPPQRLGRDGHPQSGDGLIPETGLTRRMWAGGVLQFHRPLIVGAPALRTSRVGDVTHKTGRSGPLAFVAVDHEISDDHGVAITERQDLVFRNDPEPNSPKPSIKQAPSDEDQSIEYAPSTTELFRYSALTFNGHRIHYDLEYAQNVEGYPGLIVHGPLLAQRLLDMAVVDLGPKLRFEFRAVAPVFHFETFNACAKKTADGLDLWIKAADGRLAMTGRASVLHD